MLFCSFFPLSLIPLQQLSPFPLITLHVLHSFTTRCRRCARRRSAGSACLASSSPRPPQPQSRPARHWQGSRCYCGTDIRDTRSCQGCERVKRVRQCVTERDIEEKKKKKKKKKRKKAVRRMAGVYMAVASTTDAAPFALSPSSPFKKIPSHTTHIHSSRSCAVGTAMTGRK